MREDGSVELSDPDHLRGPLAPYIDVLERAVAGEIAEPDFESVYNALYMSDETDWPNEVFDLLDGVFAEAEALVIDPEDRRHTNGAVGPADLRAYLGRALIRLRQIAEL